MIQYEIKRNCMGARVEPRGENDLHAMITVLVEDDENWIEELTISSYWLDELIDVLTHARNELKVPKAFKKTKWGYEFKL